MKDCRFFSVFEISISTRINRIKCTSSLHARCHGALNVAERRRIRETHQAGASVFQVKFGNASDCLGSLTKMVFHASRSECRLLDRVEAKRA